jgi:hypothetical protein
MGLRRAAGFLVAVTLAGGGCGGSDSLGKGGSGGGGSGGGGSGGSSASGGAGGVSGTGGSSTLACDQDLSGTWDLLAERNAGQPLTGVLVVSAGGLSLQLGPTLIYVAQPIKQATWQAHAGGTIHTITVGNTPAPLNSGSIPLALGGTWTFSTGGEQCTASAAPASVSGGCQGAGYFSGGADWPSALPNPVNGATYTATRLTSMASQFGDLGGQWQTSSRGGAGGSCTVTLAANTITTTCSGVVHFNGTMQLTIASDCTASGETGNGLAGSGFALSGQRR